VALVTLVSRRRCGLCDEARAELERVRRRVAFELEEVFIDGDDALERDYGIRVPVVLVDGREAFEIAVDAPELEAMLREGTEIENSRKRTSER
jgi:hypothetical protein